MGKSPEVSSAKSFPPNEDYAFEHHFPVSAVAQLWNLTKPADSYQAAHYFEALSKANTVADTMFFYRPFYVDKSDGSHRLIFYAQDEMAFIQHILASWLRSNVPYHDDYCYQRGRGVTDAISYHLDQHPRYGFVFDLRHAYMRITRTMLARQMELLFGRDYSQPIAVAADFMTVGGRVREGTVTAPFAYNLAMHPFDQAINFLTHQKNLTYAPSSNKPSLKYTRYADNCAFTSPDPIDFELLQHQVNRLIRGHGLELSWTRIYDNVPIEYLGTQFYYDNVKLDPDKLGLYYDTLLLAKSSPNPRIYYKTIVGQFNWLRRVASLGSQDRRLNNLWAPYKDYFAACGKMPEDARKFFSSLEQLGFDLEV